MSQFEYKGVLDIESIKKDPRFNKEAEYGLVYMADGREIMKIIEGSKLDDKFREFGCAGSFGTLTKLDTVGLS